jgi:hypothetical protein
VNTRLSKCLLAIIFSCFLVPIVSAEDKQTIVISLAEDALTGDPEPACVALQLGTGLIKSGGAEVTIFATLGGVTIGSKDALDSTRLCEQVSPQGKLQDPVELSEVLANYLDADGAILVCPLCWVARYGDLPGSASLLIPLGQGTVYPASPIPLLLEADKVIHYQ